MPARKAKVGANGALVRLGFEKSSSKIKDLPAGSSVDVVETKGERCRLRSPAGWVSAKTLEFEPELPLSPVLSPQQDRSPAKLDVQLSQRSTALEKALDTTPKAKPKKRAAKKAKSAAFDEQEPFELSGATVRCWVHARTGCRVRLVSAPGPMANLYGVLATEATEEAWCKADDGLPHTLEHLVFLGSEDYPYKGVLDKLANRCLARGTNAWTDVDHTAYTVTTAARKDYSTY